MNNSVELSAVALSIAEKEKSVNEKLSVAVDVLNGKNVVNAGKAKTSVDVALSELSKAVSDLNKFLARKYYLSATLFDVVKAGKAVPCKAFAVEESDTGKYSVALSDDVCYPSLAGMKSAGVLPEGLTDKVDVLRREVAYLDSDKKARVYLMGDVENKKDVPSKAVAELIEKDGGTSVSVNKAKSTMQVVLHDLTGGEYKKEVFSALYKDFARFIVKRGAEWTERNMVSKGVAGDMVLEYAYMYFNNLREVKYTLG